MITVAVCTADRDHLLSDLLRRLEPHIMGNSDYRLLVIDSSSTRGTARKLAEKLYLPRQLTYLEGTYSGLSAARNVAISACTTAYIAYIDDDAIPCENWLENILEAFGRNGDCCAGVGGKIYPLWLSPRPGWLADELLPYLSVLDMGEVEYQLHGTECVYGTNMAFRLSSLKRVSGFRTDLGRTKLLLLSNEESELQQRLFRQGEKVMYSPDIAVQHKIGAERLTQQWFYNRIYWQAISDNMVELDEHGVEAKLLVNLSDSPDCPASLVQAYSSQTDDPKVFLQRCEAVYENTLMIIQSDARFSSK